MEREIPYATGVMPLKTMKIKYSTLLICPTLKLLLFLLVKGRELALNGLNIGHFSFNGMTGETRIFVSMERFGLCFSNTVSILAKMDLILIFRSDRSEAQTFCVPFNKLKVIVFTVCEHEYMNFPPPNYRI